MVFHIGYVDPGSGSIILQAVIGGFFGSAYILRKWIARLASTFKRTSRPAQNSSKTAEDV